MVFRYATIADLRAEGLTTVQLDDAGCLRKLAQASSEINRVTSSWFSPVFEQHVADGRDSAMLHHSKFVPIVFLDGLYEIDPIGIGNSPQLIDPVAYVVQKRQLQLKTQWQFDTMLTGRERAILQTLFERARFDEGAGNYRMDGYFGDLPFMTDDPVTTDKNLTDALTVAATVGATTLNVANSALYSVGDVLLINKRFGAIVTAIPAGGLTLTVDPVLEAAPLAAPIRCFGQIHDGIKNACMLLVFRNRYAMGSAQGALASRRGRIREERTDNYHYKLSQAGLTPDYNSTGDAEVDRILNQFVAPAVYLGYA
jgi:hypothetical protein